MRFAADEAVWIRCLLLEVGFAIPGVHHIRSRTDDDDEDVFPSVETKTEYWVASMRPTWLLGDNQSANSRRETQKYLRGSEVQALRDSLVSYS